MTTYNGSEYLKQQLESFMNQSVLPHELIICDDMSTDDTLEIINEFKKKSPFEVKLFVNKCNLGYAANFNKSISHTSGDLIFLSDQDDVWFNNKIEVMLEHVICNQNYLLFMNDAELTDHNLSTTNLTKLGQIRSSGLNENDFVMGCCCCIKREFLDFTLPIPKGINAHDNWLVYIAIYLDIRSINNITLQYYRRHDNNESKFIANSTKKINKLNLYFSYIKILLSYKASDFNEEFNQCKIFSEGLEKITKDVPKLYRQSFDRLLESYSDKNVLFNKRMNCYNRNFLMKRFNIIKLYILDSKYHFKFLLKDFFSR